MQPPEAATEAFERSSSSDLGQPVVVQKQLLQLCKPREGPLAEGLQPVGGQIKVAEVRRGVDEGTWRHGDQGVLGQHQGLKPGQGPRRPAGGQGGDRVEAQVKVPCEVTEVVRHGGEVLTPADEYVSGAKAWWWGGEGSFWGEGEGSKEDK